MSLTKLTVNLTPRAVAAMASAAERTGDSKTDTINRALIVYDVVLDLMEQGGGKFSIERRDGVRETVRIL